MTDCIGLCSGCCFSVFTGFYVLPYLFYSEDSYFRTQWFDVWITFIFWIGAVNSSSTPVIIFENNGKFNKYQTFMVGAALFFGIINWLLTFILSCVYLKDAKPGFEIVFTIFSIVCDSFGFCAICLVLCIVIFRKEQLKEQWAQEHEPNM